MNDDLFKNLGVRIELPINPEMIDPNDVKKQYRDSFLTVRETLSRIGIASKRENILYQTAHILHKRGQYCILHFKELFSLDDRPTSFSEEDRLRRNKIVSLLEEWGLLKVLEPEKIQDKASMNVLKILHYDDKKDWVIKQKYAVGKSKKTV